MLVLYQRKIPVFYKISKSYYNKCLAVISNPCQLIETWKTTNTFFELADIPFKRSPNNEIPAQEFVFKQHLISSWPSVFIIGGATLAVSNLFLFEFPAILLRYLVKIKLQNASTIARR